MIEGEWPKVSVAFITYRRLATLRPTLSTFLQHTDYPRERLELIVADDASPKDIQRQIRAMSFDVFCLSAQQRGLGANANQALRVASGSYILQLQDDWECLGPANYLKRAIRVLEASSSIGMVILRPHPSDLPVRGRIEIEDTVAKIYDNRPEVEIGQVGQHAYTDWPHVKRRSFHLDLGLYREDLPMWEVELDFSRRVNAQSKHYIADLGIDVYRHIGDGLSFNSGPMKARLGKRIMQLPGGRSIFDLWRKAKRGGGPRHSNRFQEPPKN